MSHFTANVPGEARGGDYRVCVEGLGDAHASSLADAPAVARAIVEQSVFAAYARRRFGDKEESAATIRFDLQLARVR